MADALIVLLAAAIASGVTFLAIHKTIGERRFRDGWITGFNLAWEEKVKADEKARSEHIKRIRKVGPKLLVIKGKNER